MIDAGVKTDLVQEEYVCLKGAEKVASLFRISSEVFANESGLTGREGYAFLRKCNLQ